jgi:hypothetical protein
MRIMKAVAMRHLAAQIQPLEYEAQVKYPGAPASLDAPGRPHRAQAAAGLRA